MATPNSWEDDPAAQDENLAQQAQQQLNMNNPAPAQGGFRPGIASFQPGAASFQPGQAYGGYAPQYQQQQQQQYYQQGYYPQYGAQQGYNQYNQGYGGYNNQGYAGGGYPQYGQQQQQQQPQQPAAPTIAQRPAADAPAAAPSQPAAAAASKPKVISISGDASGPKPKTKVLSISGTGAATPVKQEEPPKAEPTDKPEAGQKATAVKAIEKTGEKAGKAATAKTSGKTSPSPGSGRNSPTAGEKKAAAREVDAVEKEQAADVDQETLKEIYGKEHVNIIFMGHVDAGKSTLGGSILYATGMVDERTMDKYKREAKDLGRESWYLSWVMDLNKEERTQGKTIEVGRGFFETEKRRYSILDAPGHKMYVPNMIGGASQADVGILVISARKGEYETGFERGGQTREHAMLAKTQGVNKLIVAVNKMDDPTVEWSHERYQECTTKLAQFLKGTGYNLKTDVYFLPIAAQQMMGIKTASPRMSLPGGMVPRCSSISTA
ncbi:hypothetical protein Lal_00008445 [Lupinus albus]|nr:hypothetical protein Lal_00008445 [Lupinus albus]